MVDIVNCRIRTSIIAWGRIHTLYKRKRKELLEADIIHFTCGTLKCRKFHILFSSSYSTKSNCINSVCDLAFRWKFRISEHELLHGPLKMNDILYVTTCQYWEAPWLVHRLYACAWGTVCMHRGGKTLAGCHVKQVFDSKSAELWKFKTSKTILNSVVKWYDNMFISADLYQHIFFD